jgi:hypothetical protein
MSINDSQVPPGLQEVHWALRGVIMSRVAQARRHKAITVGPLEYTRGGVRATITVAEQDGDRSPTRTFTFCGDYAHPDFFPRLERYLNECLVF